MAWLHARLITTPEGFRTPCMLLSASMSDKLLWQRISTITYVGMIQRYMKSQQKNFKSTPTLPSWSQIQLSKFHWGHHPSSRTTACRCDRLNRLTKLLPRCCSCRELQIRIVLLVTRSGQVQCERCERCERVKFHCFGVVCWRAPDLLCWIPPTTIPACPGLKHIHKAPRWREDLYVTSHASHEHKPAQTGLETREGIRSSKPLRTKFPAQVPGRQDNLDKCPHPSRIL